jgi:alpha-1,2-mannosyltransferase
MRRALVLAWVVCIASAASWAAVHYVRHPHMLDLTVYRTEGFAFRHGAGLYGPIGAPYDLRATYPPFAVICFAALTVLPLTLCFALAGLANLALLATAVEFMRRLVALHVGVVSAVAVPLVIAVAIWSEPVFATLHFGQINLLILVLVLWDFTRPSNATYRGVALGLATALKVTPALFVLYLLLTRRFRFAGTAAATFGAATLVGLAFRPHETARFWTSLVFSTKRVGSVANPANQSLRGVLVRAAHRLDVGAAGAALSLVVAAIGLACSVHAYRRRGEAWGVCTAGVTGLLVSPISWSHHWVWCAPIAVLFWGVAQTAERRVRYGLAAALLVFVSYLVSATYPPHQYRDLHMSAWAQLIAMPYVLFGVLFLVLAVSRWGPYRAASHAS